MDSLRASQAWIEVSWLWPNEPRKRPFLADVGTGDELKLCILCSVPRRILSNGLESGTSSRWCLGSLGMLRKIRAAPWRGSAGGMRWCYVTSKNRTVYGKDKVQSTTTITTNTSYTQTGKQKQSLRQFPCRSLACHFLSLAYYSGRGVKNNFFLECQRLIQCGMQS